MILAAFTGMPVGVGALVAACVRPDEHQQVRDRLDLCPLGLGGMDAEAPLELGDQLKAVGLAIHLKVPAEVNGIAQVDARP